MIRSEVVFTSLCVVLGIIMFTPPFLVALGDFQGTFIERLSKLISHYNGIITSLGTIFLVAAFGVWTTNLANNSAERRELANRKIQSELGLAKFRQDWINALRDDLSEFVGTAVIHYSGPPPAEKVERIVVLGMRIRMRVDRGDPDYGKLVKILAGYTELFLVGKSEQEKSDVPLMVVSQAILKREWERLKTDLREAEK